MVLSLTTRCHCSYLSTSLAREDVAKCSLEFSAALAETALTT